MKVGVVGGALQGTEAIYLSKKAGIETVVIDRRKKAPAMSLADEAVNIDVIKEPRRAIRVFEDCDAVLPANENYETLTSLVKLFENLDVPLMFDMESYDVSSSKVRSNEMMRKLKVPMPGDWPECGFPVVVKPSGQSGSTGVTKAVTQQELEEGIDRVRGIGDDCIVQEFVEGPNISVEVIGNGIEMVPLVITEVVLDDGYDCKMVRSPYRKLDADTEMIFMAASEKMAQHMTLNGIMDVEAIVKDGIPKILEIDARIPSQTPAAVLGSSGINIISMLTDSFVKGKLERPRPTKSGAAFYEHVIVSGSTMRSCGEGVFAGVDRPQLMPGLFKSDEMITDYEPGKNRWRATIINSGPSEEAAWHKRLACLWEIMEQTGVTRYVNPIPEAMK
ncbi:MAG TPA: 3-methylornithine--L-lysine ligase PylC [Methanomassiliicoccales archaeon]